MMNKGENIMIKEYFKMKKNEWKVKAQIYGIIAVLMDNQKDIADFIKKFYESLKDVSADEFKEMFVTKIVELAKETE